MEIINRYHKKLAFNINGKAFGIDTKEIKKVDDELGRELIKNYWIEEIKKPEKPFEKLSEKKQVKTEKTEIKGRVSLKTKNSFDSKKF